MHGQQNGKITLKHHHHHHHHRACAVSVNSTCEMRPEKAEDKVILVEDIPFCLKINLMFIGPCIIVITEE